MPPDPPTWLGTNTPHSFLPKPKVLDRTLDMHGYVCVCVLNVLLLGQQHSENGLGEWVEFTGGKRSL